MRNATDDTEKCLLSFPWFPSTRVVDCGLLSNQNKKFPYNKTNQMHQFLKFIFGIKLYIFRTVPLYIIRSFSLYSQQWYMSYRFADCLLAGSGCSVLILLASCQHTFMTYTIAVCTVKNS